MCGVSYFSSVKYDDVMIIERISNKKPRRHWKGSGWTLVCRLFVCCIGAFLMGYGIYDYIKGGHHLWTLICLISVGLVFILLGASTSAKTCEKIADGITCGF